MSIRFSILWTRGPVCRRAIFLGLIVIGAISANLASAAAAEPSAKGKAVMKWEVTPDAPDDQFQWPEPLKVVIPQGLSGEFLIPSRTSPFCLVSGAQLPGKTEMEKPQAWNLATGTVVSTLNAKPAGWFKKVISPDGKFLAAHVLDPNGPITIEVWSLEDGRQLTTIKADEPKMSVKLLDFAATGEVVTNTFGGAAGKQTNHWRVWSAEKGALLRELNIQTDGPGNFYISPGGRWLASASSSQITIHDLQTGEKKGEIALPSKFKNGKIALLAALRFSADGKELAALTRGSTDPSDPENVLGITVFDNATGQMTLSHEVRNTRGFLWRSTANNYKGPPLEFVGSQVGFFVDGRELIDRKSGRVVWRFHQRSGEHNDAPRILTPTGLIASAGDGFDKKIQVLPFSGEKLDRSIDALNENADAFVKPGDKVTLNIEMKESDFPNARNLKIGLEQSLSDRLTDGGLIVGADGATTVKVVVKNTTGKKSNNPAANTLTKPQPNVPSADLLIQWTGKDGKAVLFEDIVPMQAALLLEGNRGEDPNARANYTGMFDPFVLKVPFPCFIPADKNLIALPAMTSSYVPPEPPVKESAKPKMETKKKKSSK